jgi:hypothetical protein
LSRFARLANREDKVRGGNLTDEEPPAGLGWPAACPDFEANADPDCSTAIADCADIAACIGCVAAAAVDQAISAICKAGDGADERCDDDVATRTSPSVRCEVGWRRVARNHCRRPVIVKCGTSMFCGRPAGPASVECGTSWISRWVWRSMVKSPKPMRANTVVISFGFTWYQV